MNKFLYLIVIILIAMPWNVEAQEKESPEKGIPELLKSQNKRSVPYVSVQTLKMEYDDYVILDTRKKEEYEVSHLPNAIWVGEKYSSVNFPEIDKEDKVVVYCSVGIRSESYGEDLLKNGFKNVYNLYGSIFSWKDAGYRIVDAENEPTEKVHVFGKIWAKYLKTGEKVY